MKYVLRFLLVLIAVGALLLVNIAAGRYAYSTGGLPTAKKNVQAVDRYSRRHHFFYYGGFYGAGRSYKGAGGVGGHK